MSIRRLFFILLVAAFPAAACAEKAGPGTLAGWFAPVAGKSAADGVVVIFNAARGPAPGGNYLRVPEKIVRLDRQGAFAVEMPEGTYYVGVIIRSSGDAIGPPGAGDTMVTLLDGNGRLRTWDVRAGEVAPVGALSQAVPVQGSNAARLNKTAVEGLVVDDVGRPVSGAFVFAWPKASRTGPPVFVSDRSGPDGHYSLRVDHAGDYYLIGTRAGGGRALFPGDGGVLDGESGIIIHIKEGTVLPGRNIRVVDTVQ